MLIDTLKKEVIDGVRKTNNESHLHQMHSIIRQDVIAKAISKLINQKGINYPEVFIGLNRIILNSDGEVNSKLNFLREVTRRGIIDEIKLLSVNTLQNLSALIHTRHQSLLEALTDTLMNWTPQISQSFIGRGELFFFLFAHNTFQGTRGDLLVGTEEVEIKARASRMIGTTGYSTPPSIYKSYFFPELKKKYKKASTNPNHYNFNVKGIARLSDVYFSICDEKWCRNHLRTTISRLYHDAPDKMIHKFIDAVMDKNGRLDEKTFIRHFFGLQFEYYKYKDGWKGILFINPHNYNIMYIKTAESLMANLDKFKTIKSFSWKEDRCVTYQLTLK